MAENYQNQPTLTHSEMVTENEPDLSLLDVAQILADNLRLLVLAPLAVGVVTLALTFRITPTFTANTKFLPPQQQQSAAASMIQSLGSLGGLAGAAAGLKNPTDQYIAFLKTRAITDVLVDRFDLLSRYNLKYRQDARKVLEDRTKITSGKDNIITLEFDDKDPDFAANVANEYINELRNLVTRMAVTEAKQRRIFFENLLLQTKKNLASAEQALTESGITTATINTLPSAALEGPARLRAQITAQEVRIASLSTYLTARAPELQQAQSELTALRAQLAKLGQEKPKDSEKSGDYINKLRNFKYQETLFELLTKQYEIARIDESNEGSIQVIDKAQPPEKKSKPKKLLITIAATAITFILILFGVFLRKSWTAASQSEATAERIGSIKKSLRSAIRGSTSKA